MSPKLIRTQCSLHAAGKKHACTHMLRSARAHPRCILHSSSAHACTSLEAHAHRADRTQKSENSNLCKHKYGKHAQTEPTHRHVQGMGHAGTKGCGRHDVIVDSFFLSFFISFLDGRNISDLSSKSRSEPDPNIQGKHSFVPKIWKSVTFCDILWHFQMSQCHNFELGDISRFLSRGMYFS